MVHGTRSVLRRDYVVTLCAVIYRWEEIIGDKFREARRVSLEAIKAIVIGFTKARA